MSSPSRSVTLETRSAQMFPTLTMAEIERMHRFGTIHRYADGERLVETGKPSPGMFVVLSGSIRVIRHDGLTHQVPLVEHPVGGFSAEIAQLSGKPALVDAFATGTLETLLIAPDQLRALLIAEAALGEKIMRALILRRVGLIETGSGGPVFIGSPSAGTVLRLREFLSRNGQPHQFFDPATDEDAKAFIEQYARSPDDLPLIVCPDGTVLRNPSEDELARCIGMLDIGGSDNVYDVAVIGAGPAGLATAVYAASEGLSVLVIDAHAFGGQAGASARIENYLGFPTGISGQALAGRAFTQAQKFGARMLIPAEVRSFECDRADGETPLVLHLAHSTNIQSRAIVLASGARYRRPVCANLKALEGFGVWYWASPLEAKMCAGEEVVLVGGGNSAGQAAVFLSAHASKVWMLVRGPGLAASMSKYLIDRIAATPNIELRTHTEIVGLSGSRRSGVESVTWRHRQTGVEEAHSLRNVFLFLGADPATDFLKECGIALDDKNFVKTGAEVSPAEAHGLTTARMPLETSVPGVFAIGDVRAGSVKRVGAAIGEGAAVVAQIHSFIARQNEATLHA
jgi:thioredoxin reductase (NADPH)